MKKRISALVICISLFIWMFLLQSSASAGVNWGPLTITKTSQAIVYADKSDISSADLYFSKSYYPSGYSIQIRIYDYTGGYVASSWATYTPTTSGNYYKVTIPYNSGCAISGHTYVLNLRWPSGSSISSRTLAGTFYP